MSIENKQIDETDFVENEQELTMSISSEMKSIFDQTYMNEIMEQLESQDAVSNVDFKEMWTLLLQGEVWEVVKMCYGNVGDLVGYELAEGKNLFFTVFLFAVFSSLFGMITDVIKNQQTWEMGQFFLYFLLMIVLGKNFLVLYQQSERTITSIVDFVKILLPAYAAAIGLSGCPSYAVAYYELILLVIFGVEKLLLKVVLPAIQIYVLLILVSGVWKDDRLRLLLSTIKKGILICLKISLWALGAMGILQSMIMPAVESLRANGIKKMISVIPGIGALSEGVSDIFLGSAVLIKNGIGVFITFLLLLSCMAPLIKMVVYTFLIKCASALGGMISRSGMVSAADRIADADFLLCRVVLTALGLFLMSIAISILAVKGVM